MLITCMGIAFVFWVLVKLSQSYPTVKLVVLHIDMPEDKSLLKHPPLDIKAELKGTGWDLMLEHFYHSKIPVFIPMLDNNSLYLNQNRMRTEIRNSLRFNEIEVLSVNYDDIQIQLDDKKEKKVPIVFNSELVFAAGNQLKQAPSFTPDSVLLTGPTTLLDSIFSWPTKMFQLDDIKSSSTFEVDLQIPRLELKLYNDRTTVSLEVEQFTEKTLYIPVQVLHTPEGDSLKIFPDKIQLTCQVGLSRYNEVAYQDFTIEADLKDVPLQEGKNTVTVRLTRQPLFVKGTKLERKSVEFYIVK